VSRKFAQEEGFTLAEVLVAMAMMAVVLFALYAMFDASVRIFGAGRDRAEAAQAARLGLARMAREIRAAYPQDRSNGNKTLLSDFTQERLTFGNDLNGNRRTLDPATGALEGRDRISYTLDRNGEPLRNGVRLVEGAGDVDGDGRALTFEYLDSSGGPVVSGSEENVALVRIELEISVGGDAGGRTIEQTLTTVVALRNRGGA
jgi:prepilin-type N-terminal cleavage/methylation domain-containing protein